MKKDTNMHIHTNINTYYEYVFIIKGITGSRGALAEWPDTFGSTVKNSDTNINPGMDADGINSNKDLIDNDIQMDILPLQFLEPVLIMKGIYIDGHIFYIHLQVYKRTLPPRETCELICIYFHIFVYNILNMQLILISLRWQFKIREI
jgi:hypothetical protein